MAKTSAPISSRDDVLTAFGAALKRHRLKSALTQEQLAEAVELHVTYISQVERGLKNVTLYNIVRFARALSTTPSSLLKDLAEAG